MPNAIKYLQTKNKNFVQCSPHQSTTDILAQFLGANNIKKTKIKYMYNEKNVLKISPKKHLKKESNTMTIQILR